MTSWLDGIPQGETCPVVGQVLPVRPRIAAPAVLAARIDSLITFGFLNLPDMPYLYFTLPSWRPACIVPCGNRLGRSHDAGNHHLECFDGQRASHCRTVDRAIGAAGAFPVCRIVSGNCKSIRSKCSFAPSRQATRSGTAAGSSTGNGRAARGCNHVDRSSCVCAAASGPVDLRGPLYPETT